MKTLLIIYPHWVPSNLVGVMRPRLIANFLSELGWKPIVLTVMPEYYEEPPDNDLHKTVSPDIEVIKVHAKPVNTGLRIFGDIALRAFSFLYEAAIKLITSRKIDFIWIPIPSFYTAILGRRIYERTKIPYGIDYIDPWVNGFAGQEKKFSRAWLANKLASILEPYSVKKASLITGVSTAYYQGVLDRNFKNKKILHAGMPYGFCPADHAIDLPNVELPWANYPNCIPYIYAGAFLPKSHKYINALFKSISSLKNKKLWNDNIHLFFIGTTFYSGKTIIDYAKQYGINNFVHEQNARSPYLQVLNILKKSSGVLVIGSTEKHYTASKTFQGILSTQPVFSIFHTESTALQFLGEANANQYSVGWNDKINEADFERNTEENFLAFINKSRGWNPNYEALNQYSALNSAKVLVECLNKITN